MKSLKLKPRRKANNNSIRNARRHNVMSRVKEEEKLDDLAKKAKDLFNQKPYYCR